jgi:glucose/arabinose dehydrogenase
VTPAGAITLPSGFDDQPVATISNATSLAFVPDGRMLLVTKDGVVRVYENGALTATPALDISAKVCDDSERGLLGVAVDPSFGTNHFVYLYYTYNKFANSCPTNSSTSPVNRVSRFVLGDDDVIAPASEIVLYDNIPSPNGNHNAGDMQFGHDGYVYVSVGDGGCDFRGDSGCAGSNNAARDLGTPNGKILRIMRDGAIPPGNPYQGAGTARCNVTGTVNPATTCQEIYAWGLRNPWRLAFDPNAAGTRFYINDVGQNVWEEIDVAAAGADFGWNVREGHCATGSTTDCGAPPAGMTNPIYDYSHTSGCISITGGAFVPAGIWPTAYDGAYLFSDLSCGKIWNLAPAGGVTDFATGLESGTAMIHLGFGPYGSTQALYYIDWQAPEEIRRIVYTGTANRSPTARLTASPTSGSVPLTVSFNGGGSTDPDGDALSYSWSFGDGASATGVTASHTYTSAGTYTATLTVSDGRSGSDSQTVRIDAGNTPPQPVISSPATSKRFRVGEMITLSGGATDAEDGTLPGTALSWEVVKHHADHTHPFLSATPGSSTQITAPAPEDILSTTNSYLEIRLTATDSDGLSRTISQNLQPHLVNLTFASVPSGLLVSVGSGVGGGLITTPVTMTSWEGWALGLDAADQEDSAQRQAEFVSWSDGGARSHAITTPASPATYTATFRVGYVRPKGAAMLRVPLVPAYRACSSPNTIHGTPLNSSSCAPPQLQSTMLTVGTPDANGKVANSAGSLRLDALTGDPQSTADEADLLMRLDITDVRLKSNLSDYTGELEASLPLQVTDRTNGSPSVNATTQDLTLALTARCQATADTGIGSRCAVTTTADTLLPGSILEGERAVWQVARILVYDGGSDGVVSTEPNTPFAAAGIFVP